MAHAGNRPCGGSEQDLVLYHYGECREPERHRLEAHLETCGSCRDFLADLRRLVPLTAKTDDPSNIFWESYSREMKQKLAVCEQKNSWWNTVPFLFRTWLVPVTAALVVVLAILVTLGKGLWEPQQTSPEHKAMFEPVTEELDFFKSLDLLDSLDLLEAAGGGKLKTRGA